MILEALAGSILGITGALPFTHTNLVLQFVQGILKGSQLAIFSVSLTVSHAFFEIGPAFVVFSFGARSGEARHALKSAFLALIASILLLPFFWFALPFLKTQLAQTYKFVLLALVITHLVEANDFWATAKNFGVFIIAGLMGMVVLGGAAFREPLFPMLSGFFALPTLLLGKQGDDAPNCKKVAGSRKVVIYSVFASALSTLFPALTVGVLLGILLLISKSSPMTAVSSLIVSKAFYDIAASAITGSTRSLAAVIVLPFSENFGAAGLIMIASAALVAGSFALGLAIALRKRLENAYEKAQSLENRRPLLALLLIAIALAGGICGLLIAATACLLAICAAQLKVRRSCLMAALLLPALAYAFELEAHIGRMAIG